MSPLSKAIRLSVLWFLLAMLFNIFLWYAFTHEMALEFFTGYLIEKLLSLDNILVFSAIFQQLRIPISLQGRVLSYGLVSAFILRFLMIWGGVWLLSHFSFMLPLFGFFLLIISWKCFKNTKNSDNSLVFLWIKKKFRFTNQFYKNHFFMRINHQLYATPLFLCLLFIEMSDVIFAIDSIPAIFAVTQNSFIIFTSNMFAILGLRSLYTVLSHAIEKMRFLQQGLSVILLFIGGKLIVSPWIHMPILVTLFFIVIVLIITIILSLRAPLNHS